MNTRALFTFFAFGIMHSFLTVQGTAQPQVDRTPFTPGVSGTYYYEGFDAANSRYVYLSSTGTYYYVDTGNITTTGGATEALTVSPYRVVTDGSATTFQFDNSHRNLYTFTSTTGTNGEIIPVVDFSVRSGTWSASDVTLTQSYNTGTDTAALRISGVSGTYSGTMNDIIDVGPILDVFPSATNVIITPPGLEYGDGSHRLVYPQPVVFTGTNVNIFVDVADNISQQAVSVNNGAEVILSGGTISKIYSGTAVGSETIHLVGNQEGDGSKAKFTGTNLTIITSGSTLEAFSLANGSTEVKLYDSTISSTIWSANPNAQVFYINDQQKQGGGHFYAENTTIDVVNSSTAAIAIRTFAFGYGENSVTLKNSTITTSGGKGAVFRWITSEGTGGNAGGNEAMSDGFISTVKLEDTNVTTNGVYAPIFQQSGRFGWAEVTGGTLTTTGSNSPIIRLVGANDSLDESKFTGIFTNVLLDAQNSSAIDLDLFVRDSTNYGEDGGGVGKEVTTLISTTWDLLFISSTLNGTSALRLATAGVDNSPYSNWTYLTARDSDINGRIEMLVSGKGTGSYETSGANLYIQAFNSNFTGGFFITGTEVARKIHEARIELFDSTWIGDITAENRGETVLYFKNSPLTGNFALSGSTNTYLDLIDSDINGSISLDGTATLKNKPGSDIDGRVATVLNSPISGGFSLAGASAVDLTFVGEDSVVSNGITATGTATGIFRFQENSSLNGGIALSGSSFVEIKLSSADQLTGDLVVLDRATLALTTFDSTPINLNRGFTLGGIWKITGQTTLEGSLDITNRLGTISIANASPESLFLRSGMTGKGRLEITSFRADTNGMPEIHVIHDLTGTWAADALILARPVDNGLVSYGIENRADGAYLIGGLGDGGAAVINSQSLAVEEWYASFAPLNYRLNRLREGNAAIFDGSTSHANGDAGAFWAQGRTDTTRVKTGGSLNFESRVIGMTVGADTRWDQDTGSFAAGVFLDTARTDRDFSGDADGSTTSVGGGFYLHYQHRMGFFVSAIARFDTYENSLDTNNPNNDLSADYNSQAGGVAIDAGWRFSLTPDSGWWFEPAYQIAFLKMPGVSYTTDSKADNKIDIETQDGRATQHTLRFAFGRSLNEKWSFRGHILAAKVDASGGEFTATRRGYAYSPADFNNSARTIAEDRAEVSIGISRLVGRAGRLNIDLSFTEADAYDRPCSIFFGYTHLW